jgi:hypothetical protein
MYIDTDSSTRRVHTVDIFGNFRSPSTAHHAPSSPSRSHLSLCTLLHTLELLLCLRALLLDLAEVLLAVLDTHSGLTNEILSLNKLHPPLLGTCHRAARQPCARAYVIPRWL